MRSPFCSSQARTFESMHICNPVRTTWMYLDGFSLFTFHDRAYTHRRARPLPSSRTTHKRVEEIHPNGVKAATSTKFQTTLLMLLDPMCDSRTDGIQTHLDGIISKRANAKPCIGRRCIPDIAGDSAWSQTQDMTVHSTSS